MIKTFEQFNTGDNSKMDNLKKILSDFRKFKTEDDGTTLVFETDYSESAVINLKKLLALGIENIEISANEDNAILKITTK